MLTKYEIGPQHGDQYDGWGNSTKIPVGLLLKDGQQYMQEYPWPFDATGAIREDYAEFIDETHGDGK